MKTWEELTTRKRKPKSRRGYLQYIHLTRVSTLWENLQSSRNTGPPIFKWATGSIGISSETISKSRMNILSDCLTLLFFRAMQMEPQWDDSIPPNRWQGKGGDTRIWLGSGTRSILTDCWAKGNVSTAVWRTIFQDLPELHICMNCELETSLWETGPRNLCRKRHFPSCRMFTAVFSIIDPNPEEQRYPSAIESIFKIQCVEIRG